MKFGKSLKQLLKEHEISQADLAKVIGYSQRAISKWINEQAEPSATAICLVAKFFGITTDELLGCEEGWNSGIMDAPLPEYTAEERNLIKAYRELRPDLQSLLLDTVALWQKQNAPSKASKKKA